MTNTAQAFTRAGNSSASLTRRPGNICREYQRKADGTVLRNGEVVHRPAGAVPPRYSMLPYEGAWGWLFWVKDKLRRGV